jgi:nicotinate-nucleotide adenylyltransferase
MTIALFFGSFNPIHNGHLGIAQFIIAENLADELWFVVSPQNPLKDKNILVSDVHRLNMARLAILNCKQMKVSDIESNLPKPSFTIDTMNFLENSYPNQQWKIIMGSDGLSNFGKWKNYNELITRYKRLVYPRLGDSIENLPFMENTQLIDAPLLDISSTEIRDAISKKIDIERYLPNEVYNYIKTNKLYI